MRASHDDRERTFVFFRDYGGFRQPDRTGYISGHDGASSLRTGIVGDSGHHSCDCCHGQKISDVF